MSLRGRGGISIDPSRIAKDLPFNRLVSAISNANGQIITLNSSHLIVVGKRTIGTTPTLE